MKFRLRRSDPADLPAELRQGCEDLRSALEYAACRVDGGAPRAILDAVDGYLLHLVLRNLTTIVAQEQINRWCDAGLKNADLLTALSAYLRLTC